MKPQHDKERDFKIDIVLKQSFLSGMWEHANRNPEWALAGIITPILTFLAGFLIKRRKKNSTINDDGENV